MGHHEQLTQRHQDLKVIAEGGSTRFCYPVGSDEIVFKGTSNTSPRDVGEILSVTEEIFSGKFSMQVDTDPQHALESMGPRGQQPTPGPIATIEVWSLEPGTYDLVLKLPSHTAQDKATTQALIDQFVDRAKSISARIDSLDLLRFEAGPSMSLPKAQSTLRKLEQQSGTQLDTDTLLSFLKLDGPSLKN